MILISACLAGISCRYNGGNTLKSELRDLLNAGKAVAVCPEVLGGLPIPRSPCEIREDNNMRRVIGKDGYDYTGAFMRGADKALSICRRFSIAAAVLQSRSPSCGYGEIYDGTFSGKCIRGNGICAELLAKNGVVIFTEENYSQARLNGDGSFH